MGTFEWRLERGYILVIALEGAGYAAEKTSKHLFAYRAIIIDNCVHVLLAQFWLEFWSRLLTKALKS